jgi:hypothetical protein
MSQDRHYDVIIIVICNEKWQERPYLRARLSNGSNHKPTGAGDAQTPPTGASAVDAWLAQGLYKAWRCEPAAHAGRSPSPHGMNRICSNDVLSAHGQGEFPVGASSVKEEYEASGQTITGYAVNLHVRSGGGDAWYWFERLPSGVGADGLGDRGTPRDSCVACHQGAGKNGASGHDFVYTQVK